MAAAYVHALRAAWPRGPYSIGGYCFGALVAFEMARILSRQKESVSMLALIDSYAPGGPEPSSLGVSPGCFFRFLTGPSASGRCSPISPSSLRSRKGNIC